MSIRIRYIKHGDGGYISAHAFKDYVGHDLKSRIYEDGVTGCVMFASGEIPIIEVSASSPHKIRIKLKKVLQKLGVRFDKESRDLEEEANG